MFYSDDLRSNYDLEKSDYLINIKVSVPHFVVHRNFGPNSETLRNKILKIDRCPRNAFIVTDNALLLFKFNKTGYYVPCIPFLFVINWKPKKKEFPKVHLFYIIGLKHFFI